MNKGSLEERTEPLLAKVIELNPSLEGCKLEIPEPYLGFIDLMVSDCGSDDSGKIYTLWIDRLNKENHDPLKGLMHVKRKTFRFKRGKFCFRGRIIDSGTVNDFDYFFVKAYKKSKPRRKPRLVDKDIEFSRPTYFLNGEAHNQYPTKHYVNGVEYYE